MKRRKKPEAAGPECIITLKNWNGGRQIRWRGVPLKIETRNPIEQIRSWSDTYMMNAIPGPSEITVTFDRGDPKVRIS